MIVAIHSTITSEKSRTAVLLDLFVDQESQPAPAPSVATSEESKTVERTRDLMADPDMTFLVAEDGVYPMTFQQDNMGLYQKAAWWEHDRLTVRPKMQADLAKFANQWMRNIEEQQF